MTRKSEKIWVVIEHSADGGAGVVVYDNPTDADHYAMEMTARGEERGRVRVIEADLNRREDLPFDDAPWGALRMDIKSEFVEGLMEDMVPLDQILPGAAERFAAERVEMVRKRAASRIDEIVKSEMKEELLHTYEEWARAKGMDD